MCSWPQITDTEQKLPRLKVQYKEREQYELKERVKMVKDWQPSSRNGTIQDIQLPSQFGSQRLPVFRSLTRRRICLERAIRLVASRSCFRAFHAEIRVRTGKEQIFKTRQAAPFHLSALLFCKHGQADEEEHFNSKHVMRRILKLAFLNAIQRRRDLPAFLGFPLPCLLQDWMIS